MTLRAKQEKTNDLTRGTGLDALTPSQSSVFGYKVKDLIHSTQEADKKLLGITTETGGGKLFREGRWRAGEVLRVEGGSWQEERRVRSYVTGEWETLSETHGRYSLPGFGGEYHSLEALCDALRCVSARWRTSLWI